MRGVGRFLILFSGLWLLSAGQRWLIPPEAPDSFRWVVVARGPEGDVFRYHDGEISPKVFSLADFRQKPFAWPRLPDPPELIIGSSRTSPKVCGMEVGEPSWGIREGVLYTQFETATAEIDLYRIRITDCGAEKLREDIAGLRVWVSADGEWVVWRETDRLYSLKADGAASILLDQPPSETLEVVFYGDWVIHRDSRALYSFRLDGTDRATLSTVIDFENKWFLHPHSGIFLLERNWLSRINPDGTGQTVVADDVENIVHNPRAADEQFISPSGHYLVYQTIVNGQLALVVITTAGERIMLLTGESTAVLHWFEDDQHTLLYMGRGYVRVSDPTLPFYPTADVGSFSPEIRLVEPQFSPLSWALGALMLIGVGVGFMRFATMF